MLYSKWKEACRSLGVAILTVAFSASLFAQPATRVGRTDSDIDNLNRMLMDGDLQSRDPSIRSNSLLDINPNIDYSKVNQQVLTNLVKEAVDESTRLYQSLDADYRRNPTSPLRPLLSQLLQLRAQASRLNQALIDRVPLQQIVVDFRKLDSEWRLLSHRLAQTPQVGTASRDSVDRIDRIDREIGKLFQVEPTLDRKSLLQQLASMESAFRVLVDELRFDTTGGSKVMQMESDARKIQSQVIRIEDAIYAQARYDQIVNEYGKFSRMWVVLLDQLRTMDNRQIERQVRYIADSNNSVQDLLWMETSADRTQLKQVTSVLMRDVNEFYTRTNLSLLLSFKDRTSVLTVADDFFGTVQNFKDLLDRNESDAQLVEAYQSVEEYGNRFQQTFSRMNSSVARIVLGRIEDGIASLRGELNISGTVTDIDTRDLLTYAASLENLAEQLDFDVRHWLNSDRQSFRNEALQASSAFVQRSRRIHQVLQGRPTRQELIRETQSLYEDFRKIYGYLGYCRTSDRANLAQMAGEIRQTIVDISAPLQF
ncbi:MAG: hypothetical protein JNL58_02520 [Planctomyces sp.]|nr:hypothetical protein [Planctomyces sp.]